MNQSKNMVPSQNCLLGILLVHVDRQLDGAIQEQLRDYIFECK